MKQPVGLKKKSFVLNTPTEPEVVEKDTKRGGKGRASKARKIQTSSKPAVAANEKADEIETDQNSGSVEESRIELVKDEDIPEPSGRGRMGRTSKQAALAVVSTKPERSSRRGKSAEIKEENKHIKEKPQKPTGVSKRVKSADTKPEDTTMPVIKEESSQKPSRGKKTAIKKETIDIVESTEKPSRSSRNAKKAVIPVVQVESSEKPSGGRKARRGIKIENVNTEDDTKIKEDVTKTEEKTVVNVESSEKPTGGRRGRTSKKTELAVVEVDTPEKGRLSRTSKKEDIIVKTETVEKPRGGRSARTVKDTVKTEEIKEPAPEKKPAKGKKVKDNAEEDEKKVRGRRGQKEVAVSEDTPPEKGKTKGRKRLSSSSVSSSASTSSKRSRSGSSSTATNPRSTKRRFKDIEEDIIESSETKSLRRPRFESPEISRRIRVSEASSLGGEEELEMGASPSLRRQVNKH